MWINLSFKRTVIIFGGIQSELMQGISYGRCRVHIIRGFALR
jgi:hypothetical protein